ncbi:hypothetical protein D3C87_1904090 [compost metagenome]
MTDQTVNIFRLKPAFVDEFKEALYPQFNDIVNLLHVLFQIQCPCKIGFANRVVIEPGF